MAAQKRERGAAPPPAAEPRPAPAVVGLAAAGAAVAGYLTWLKLTGVGAGLCVAGSGCDVVQSSRYAVLLGVPTALWGALLYVTVGVLALLGLSLGRWRWAFYLTAAGVGFSAYLTALSVLALGATCVYCLVSGGIAVAILILLIARRPPVTGRPSAMRPARLAGGGLAAAGLAILAGAFVFAMPSAAPAGYRSALARHLTETGTVMYGAFW